MTDIREKSKTESTLVAKVTENVPDNSVKSIEQTVQSVPVPSVQSIEKTVQSVPVIPDVLQSIPNVFNSLAPIAAPIAAAGSALSGVGIPLAIAIIVGMTISQSIQHKSELLKVFNIVDTILKRCLLMLEYNIIILNEYDSEFQKGKYTNIYIILSMRALLENIYPSSSIFDESVPPVNIGEDQKKMCWLFKQFMPLIIEHKKLCNVIQEEYFQDVDNSYVNKSITDMPSADVKKLTKNKVVYVMDENDWKKGKIQEINTSIMRSTKYTIKLKDENKEVIVSDKDKIRIAEDEPFFKYNEKYWNIKDNTITNGIEFFKNCIKLIDNNTNIASEDVVKLEDDTTETNENDYKQYINWPLLNKKDQTVADILMLLDSFNIICVEISNPSKKKHYRGIQVMIDMKQSAQLMARAKRYKNELIKFVTLINAHFISLNNRIEKYTGFIKTKLDMDNETKKKIEDKIYDCPAFKVLIEDRHDNTYVQNMIDKMKKDQESQMNKEMERINNLHQVNTGEQPDSQQGGFTKKRRKRNRKSKHRNNFKRIKQNNTKKNIRYNPRKTKTYRHSR